MSRVSRMSGPMAATGIWLLLIGCSNPADTTAPAEPVALVKLATVVVRPVAAPRQLYGIADPGGTGRAALVATADSIVRSIAAPPGSRVTEGDVVVQLEPNPASRLEHDLNQIELANARSALARAERLRADGLASDAEVTAARSTLANAAAVQAKVQEGAHQLAVRAPFAGFVESVLVNVGEVVPAGAGIATVVAATVSRARFGIDLEEARLVKVGSLMTVRRSSTSAPVTARVVSVQLAVDPASRLAAVFVAIAGEGSFSPGEPLVGQVSVATSDNLPVVPYAALLDDAGQPYVFVVKGGKASRRNVVVAAASPVDASIRSGLAAGEQVVTAGGTALADGMAVRTR